MLAKHKECMQSAWARVVEAFSQKEHPMGYERRVPSCRETSRTISNVALMLPTIIILGLNTNSD